MQGGLFISVLNVRTGLSLQPTKQTRRDESGEAAAAQSAQSLTYLFLTA